MNTLSTPKQPSASKFTSYAWFVLIFTLLVILWGAVVRATGSGAGCGNHWPLCNGEIVPPSPALATAIELAHRFTSGLALVATIGLWLGALRNFPSNHLARRAALWALIFMVMEALIGAGLVLLEYVASNTSTARVYWIAGHLVNTYLLLAALTCTLLWSAQAARIRISQHRVTSSLLFLTGGMMLIQGASGAVTALGDTLVLQAGINPVQSPLVGQLVALRIYHPLWAMATGLALGGSIWFVAKRHANAVTIRHGWLLIGLYAMQLVIGVLNVAWMAPVYLQLVHLLLADLIWIVFIVYGVRALSNSQPKYANPVLEPGFAFSNQESQRAN